MAGALLAFAAWPSPARADFLPLVPFAPGMQCRVAINAAEHAYGIPDRLLAAIARVESGRADPATGAVDPWPWTFNAEGEGHMFATKAEAMNAARALQGRGVQSIDTGCLQVNLMHHPAAFAGLEQAFDPRANADYAAHFLTTLFAQSGSWEKAAALYHSATPDLGADYARKVMAAWPQELRLVGKMGVLGGGLAAAGSGLAASGGAGAIGASVLPFGGAMAGHFLAATPLLPPSGGHIIPLPAGVSQIGGQAVGRSLASYRAAPVMFTRPAVLLPRG